MSENELPESPEFVENAVAETAEAPKEAKGVKELTEILVAAVALYKSVKALGSDGFQWNDSFTFVKDLIDNEGMRKQLFAAFKDADKVLDEIKDINLEESAQIVKAVLDELNK